MHSRSAYASTDSFFRPEAGIIFLQNMEHHLVFGKIESQ